MRVVEPTKLTDRDWAAWAALESRAIEPHPWLSPHFMLPAVRHLEQGSKALVFLTERFHAGQRGLAATCPPPLAPFPDVALGELQHAAKPEWWSMAEESLTTIAVSL